MLHKKFLKKILSDWKVVFQSLCYDRATPEERGREHERYSRTANADSGSFV